MATDPTGEVRHTADGYAARVTWRGGRDRHTFPLPHASDRAAAKERANVLAGMAAQFRRNGVIDDPRARKIAELVASASPTALDHFLQVAGELVGGELQLIAPKSSQDPTVRDITERWIALRRAEAARGDVASATVSANVEHLQHRILPALGDVRVSLLGAEPTRLRHFVADLREQPRTRAGRKKTRIVIEGTKLSNFRVRNVCATLSKLLDDAIAEGWVHLSMNPMRHPAVKVPRAVTLANGEVIFIERDSAALLLNSTLVGIELRTRCTVGLLTALDIAEISGLSFEHLDLDGSVPTVRVERCFTQTGKYGPTKRPSRVRLVPLHPLVVTALRSHTARWVERFGRQPEAGDPLFAAVEVRAGVRTPIPRYWHGAADDLRAALELVGCATVRNGHPITAKSMRRSFATWLHEAGVEESVIGRLMGHAAKSVTGRHYTAADLARLYEAVCRIELRREPPARPADDASGGVPGANGPAMAPETSCVASPMECKASELLSAPDTIRTYDPRFRKPLLYPLSYGGSGRPASSAGPGCPPAEG